MADFFLQSSRLGFRVWHESDLSLARALWGDPAVARFIAVGGFSEDQIRARLEGEIETQQLYGIQYWPIFLIVTGEHIGCCGLRPHGGDPGAPEFGVHISSRHWRQGYAFEAASCVIDHAFKIVGTKALFAGHNPSNTASRGLLTRLGFVYTHDEFYEPTGLRHPSYMLARSQWPPNLALNTDSNRRAFDRTGEAG
jgi:RimJ/RimL family protein N-acetyltransferase